MKVWIALLSLLALVLGTANAQNATISYKIANAQSLGGESFSGDIVIERNNGTADVVPFVGTGNELTAGGTPFVPPLCSGSGVGSITHTPAPPRDGPPIQVQGAWWPLVPAGFCLVTTAYVRSHCSRDCGEVGGVKEWDSGVCGHKATCSCNLPAPPPPGPSCSGPNPSPACQEEWPRPAPQNHAWSGAFPPFHLQHGDFQLLIEGFYGW